jgi:hypothetical protein
MWYSAHDISAFTCYFSNVVMQSAYEDKPKLLSRNAFSSWISCQGQRLVKDEIILKKPVVRVVEAWTHQQHFSFEGWTNAYIN